MSTIFLSTRPPVTPSDAEKLKSLWEAVPQNDIDMFEIHGYIRDIRSQRQTLMYTFEQGGKRGAKVLQLDNLDTEPLGDLYKTINQGSAVEGDTIQTEPGPKELSRDRFSLNFNPLELGNGVLASISAFCKIGVEANLSCLKVITKDDCSEKTSDTEAREDYVGSLVAVVHTGCEGGKLVLFKGDHEKAICWGAKEETHETSSLRWAFIPLGVKSQFHAITSGYCLALN
ncbi:hypothetical protein FS837_008090 [Tulasnella sp. UAMH 9824]|nr:hypothetical protein FS837_008090 [Tulasnella sp. UAMH 9824]